MAITFNDGITNYSPKPLDQKAYVGISDPNLLFLDKDDISMSMRHIGMTVTDVDSYQVWRLEGGIENDKWKLVDTGGTDIDTYFYTHAGVDNHVFSFPVVGFLIDNTIITVNGVELPHSRSTGSSTYNVIPEGTSTRVIFSFDIEAKDVIQLTKI